MIFLFRMVWRRLIFGQGRRIEEALRNRLFEHLLRLSQSYYHRTSIGDLMAHATNDMEAVRMALGMGLVSMMDSLVLGSAAIAFMAYINLKLTLISLWPMPLAAFLTQRLSRLLHQRFEMVQGTFSQIMEKVRESLVGIMVVKAYTLQEREEKNLARFSLKYQDQNIALARVTSTLFPVIGFSDQPESGGCPVDRGKTGHRPGDYRRGFCGLYQLPGPAFLAGFGPGMGDQSHKKRGGFPGKD